MEYKDYYRSLGVSRNASQDEIKSAFRNLARKHHPDANEGDSSAEERFKEINEAYQVLSDPDKRQKYDQFGSQWEQYSRAGGSPDDFDWGRWSAGPGTYSRSVNMEDLEGLFGGGGGVGGFSDFFETLFGRTRGSGPAQSQRRGGNIEQEVEITLDEAYSGTERLFQTADGKRYEVKIPKGVHTGSRVRVAGKGGGAASGIAGDLYLKIKILPNPIFKPRKKDLLVKLMIDLYTAVLGGDVTVPTLQRPVVLTVPAGTENGKTFRLRGKGLPDVRNPEKFGDILASIEIQLPKDLSDRERELFEELRSLK